MNYKNKPLVIIESPYAGDFERNKKYCRRCLKDSLEKDEVPFASHLLYTQVLDDTIPKERKLGMEAGFAVTSRSDFTAVYQDYGLSNGMLAGIGVATQMGHEVVYRNIGKNDES